MKEGATTLVYVLLASCAYAYWYDARASLLPQAIIACVMTRHIPFYDKHLCWQDVVLGALDASVNVLFRYAVVTLGMDTGAATVTKLSSVVFGYVLHMRSFSGWHRHASVWAIVYVILVTQPSHHRHIGAPALLSGALATTMGVLPSVLYPGRPWSTTSGTAANVRGIQLLCFMVLYGVNITRVHWITLLLYAVQQHAISVFFETFRGTDSPFILSLVLTCKRMFFIVMQSSEPSYTHLAILGVALVSVA